MLDALHALDFLLIAGLLGGDSAVAESGSLLLSPALPAQAGNTVFRAVVPDCDIETWSETIGDHVSVCCALSAQARAGVPNHRVGAHLAFKFRHTHSGACRNASTPPITSPTVATGRRALTATRPTGTRHRTNGTTLPRISEMTRSAAGNVSE